MAMALDPETDLSFPYWTTVRRRFGPDSSFFASGNLERELLAKQVALDLTADEKHQLQNMVYQDTRFYFAPAIVKLLYPFSERLERRKRNGVDDSISRYTTPSQLLSEKIPLGRAKRNFD
ncbi:hypothetical protein SLEP1_g48215 [Rubroshorea leprosula]|uniref:Uncharacterized protein n=1 Tax=Rubroshorea leprosula TaxID=152421 RepID=A0AAV5LSX2_9ROSI|nr:hypothetical protein SLEP1_g48215 [Rubroshorea leprosula]